MTFRLKTLPAYFLIARLVLFISLPLEGVSGYGDLVPFYNLAELDGWPLFDYWIEFPPLFPWILELVYRLIPRENAVIYVLAFGFSVAQAYGLALFIKLAQEIWGDEAAGRRSLVFFALSIGLFYGWTYMDGLVMALTLAGLYVFTRGQYGRAGLLLAIGALTKWFSLLALPALWRYQRGQSQITAGVKKASVIALGIVALLWLTVWIAAPAYTQASLLSQGSKGSWETVWALVDGNLNTGNFGPLDERFDPALAATSAGNPAKLPNWLTLLTFGSIGLFLFLQARLETVRELLGFVGITIVLFFLWSPGWSPQWVLVLIPLPLLVLPERRAIMITLLLAVVSLIEWPLLLSRGLFGLLWLPIVLRNFLFLLLLVDYWPVVSSKKSSAYVQ